MAVFATRSRALAALLLAGARGSALGCAARGSAPPTAEPATRVDPAASLQPPERWLAHVETEILPFWSTPAALGDPPGDFPTFRCNDGSAFDPEAPCRELTNLPDWLASELGTEYTRMKARQAFAYGAAFHLTGDERYLTWMRAGVDWLRAHAYEPDSGSAISWWRHGVSGPAVGARTAQDLAYAQLGLAFDYYLTRRPPVLADLDRLHRHLMARYWDAEWGMLRWVLPPADAATDPQRAADAARQELVAQLDPINAYLMLVAPLLDDDAVGLAWREDLRRLAGVVRHRYFAPEHGLFWGTLHDPAERRLGGRHVDFGHTIKALWMLYLAGQAVDEPDLVEFARRHAGGVLERAALPSGCWASGLRADGTLDAGQQWWVFAELDQAAATFALREPDGGRYARFLPPSHACWLERFVDRAHGGIWPGVPADWTPDTFAERRPLKQFHWKSGYHEMEHALVAAITTAGLTERPLDLHYAFVVRPPTARIRPYLFAGRVAAEQPLPLPQHPGLAGVRVTFRDIR
jgi:mannose/cellobiose epimerase-like protein (N-acyl-D-glucosamine 2-epimerase family)